jgi:hypothetical protein
MRFLETQQQMRTQLEHPFLRVEPPVTIKMISRRTGSQRYIRMVLLLSQHLFALATPDWAEMSPHSLKALWQSRDEPTQQHVGVVTQVVKQHLAQLFPKSPPVKAELVWLQK